MTTILSNIILRYQWKYYSHSYNNDDNSGGSVDIDNADDDSLRWFNVHWQLIYGYVETDDDNDDETDRHPVLHVKDKGYFTPHTT